MKKIELKTVEVLMDGKPTRLSYRLQIEEIIKAPSAVSGADIEEIRRSLRILDALEACPGDALELEDADYEFMKVKVQNARWPIIDKYVLAFVDDVTGG